MQLSKRFSLMHDHVAWEVSKQQAANSKQQTASIERGGINVPMILMAHGTRLGCALFPLPAVAPIDGVFASCPRAWGLKYSLFVKQPGSCVLVRRTDPAYF
jgi:hypothetical protein